MTDNQEKSSLRKIPNVGSQTEQDLIATAVVLFVFILIINLSFSIISRKANA
jgi:ABC-type phosphate transport system permease subunit